MKNNHKIIYIFCSLLVFTVFGLSIGYASFYANFYVSDISGTVLSQTVVRITDVSVKQTSNGAVANSEGNDISKIYLDASLPNSTSTITYNVTVRNFGNVPMGIGSITMNQANQNILDIDVQDGIIGEILENNGSTLGITKTFTITLKYKDGAYASASTHDFNNIELGVNFKEAHNVTYTNLTSTNYPKSVLDGGTLTVNMSNSQPDIIKVKLGNAYTSNFTYTNYILTMNNVTDDVTIEKIDTSEMTFVINNNTTDIASGITTSSPISVRELFTTNLDGINGSDKVVNKMDVTITYSSATGAAQSFGVSLQVNGTTVGSQQTVNVRKQSTSATLTFSNLNISKYDTFTIVNNDNEGMKNYNINITGYSIHLYFS